MTTAELNALFINYYHLEDGISFPEIAGLKITKDDILAILRECPHGYDAFINIYQFIALVQADLIESRLNTQRDLSASY
jgi:hypothetical protein